MSKARLTTLVSALLFLRWLVTGHVTMTVAGAPVAVPALAVAAATAIAVAGAVAALVVYRARAEQAMLADRAMHAAWQAQKAATS
jgi:hypothetical protein